MKPNVARSKSDVGACKRNGTMSAPATEPLTKGPSPAVHRSMADDRGPILLVDDDAEILITTARYLRARGLKVVMSRSA
jgi:hypothetical protein